MSKIVTLKILLLVSLAVLITNQTFFKHQIIFILSKIFWYNIHMKKVGQNFIPKNLPVKYHVQ